MITTCKAKNILKQGYSNSIFNEFVKDKSNLNKTYNPLEVIQLKILQELLKDRRFRGESEDFNIDNNKSIPLLYSSIRIPEYRGEEQDPIQRTCQVDDSNKAHRKLAASQNVVSTRIVPEEKQRSGETAIHPWSEQESTRRSLQLPVHCEIMMLLLKPPSMKLLLAMIERKMKIPVEFRKISAEEKHDKELKEISEEVDNSEYEKELEALRYSGLEDNRKAKGDSEQWQG
ncbi:hypothetical protein Glove_50g99 [Diversispora epigaea]|uniref:Uncharacterized protein n=1 Tax=Diversispora epigaea TaxID=1348612 RepID=A0A397JMX6_9GLOM|nr:hypothetical protein Glove_50g99 [Diversispora epigaea]